MSIVAAFAVPHPPLIIADVGGSDARIISKTIDAYRQVAQEVAELHPDAVVITSPHSIMYMDYFHISPGSGASGDFGQFNAPQVRITTDYDEQLAKEIEKQAKLSGIPAGTLGQRDRRLDHATMIPLYFLQQQFKDFKTVRIGLSGLPALVHYRFGICIKQAVENLGRKVVFIASGDLSHKLKSEGPYGFSPDGPVYDKMIQDVFENGDFMRLLAQDESFCESAAECGQKSFEIMAGALDGMAVDSKLLSYEGPFGVGYGVGQFIPKQADSARCFASGLANLIQKKMDSIRSKEDSFVHLARLSVESYIRTGKRAVKPEGLPPEMTEKRAGTFVSLHKDGNLRGCIGTISPVEPCIADEIISNAISACTRDPRFEPVEEKELDSLVYSVDVLGPYEKIESESQLDVKRYGVIVQRDSRRGLLLPNLDGVDTPAQQIEIARQKAGIRPEEEVQLYRFEVVRHF